VHFPNEPSGCYGSPAADTTLTMTTASRIDNTPIALGQQASMTILHADGATTRTSTRTASSSGSTWAPNEFCWATRRPGIERSPPIPITSSIEGVLLDCCPSEVAANVMIVGHHGSETSSRRAFINAVGASICVVSSGPTKYASVVLPDSVIISELQGLGQVFRTDVNDAACAVNPVKIGPPADGKAGGCNAVRIAIPGAGAPVVSPFPTP
jgi:hypothetical protein